MRIALAAIHGCFSSGVAALLDILRTADARRGTVDGSIPPLEVRVLGPGPRVTTSSGMDLPVDGPLSDLGTHDVAVVPAMGTMTGDDTLTALGHPDARALVAALGRLAPTAHTVAAACTGVFPVAEAGWLERRRATTSWWLWPAFRQRYPTVTLDVDAMVVADDHVVTAVPRSHTSIWRSRWSAGTAPRSPITSHSCWSSTSVRRRAPTSRSTTWPMTTRSSSRSNATHGRTCTSRSTSVTSPPRSERVGARWSAARAPHSG